MSKILTGGFENTYETIEKNRGQKEHRIHVVSDIFDEFVNFSFDWKGLRTLGAVVAFRQVGESPQNIEDISSADLAAEKLATSVRSHCAVENTLHYVLDVSMSEDACQIRRGDAAEILSGFRHIALNLLKNEKTFKGGIQRKTRCAMMSTRLSGADSGRVATTNRRGRWSLRPVMARFHVFSLTLGVALAIREVDGRDLALEDITLRYYISSAELSAEKLKLPGSTGLSRINCTGSLTWRWVKMIAGFDGEMPQKSWQAFGILL